MLQRLFSYFKNKTDEWLSIHSSEFSFCDDIDLYIKANSELIFHHFFINRFEVRDPKIDKFVKFFLENRLFEKIEYIQSTYLVLIYIDFLFNDENLIREYKCFDSSDIKGILSEIGIMEIMCYEDILQDKYDDNILNYFINTNYFKSIFLKIPTLLEMYLFTHAIFYILYLGNYSSKNIKQKYFFEKYLTSLLGYAINSENYDLIGELLLCFFILDLDVEKYHDLLNIAMKYLKHFLDHINLDKLSKEDFYSLYHPILVIDMLSNFYKE